MWVRDSHVTSYMYSTLYLSGGTFTDGIIRGVSSGDGGAGGGGRPAFLLVGNEAKLLNTIITNSVSQGVGAGEIEAGMISNCTFIACKKSNSSTSFAGALCLSGGKVIDCKFINCEAENKAAIVRLISKDAILRNALIADNKLASGSALSFEKTANNATTVNCRAENCTVANNHQSAADAAFVSGCTIAAEGGTLHNTIIWGNTNASGDQSNLIVSDPETGIIEHCMTNNPSFRKAGNYRLKRKSKAKGAGERLEWMTGALDLDGRPRIIGKEVDLGCYECELGSPTMIMLE